MWSVSLSCCNGVGSFGASDLRLLEGVKPAWQARVYNGFFFDVLGRLVLRFMKESASCHHNTDYSAGLEVIE